MYPSDYGYAAGESCLSTALSKYNSGCANSNYLFIGSTSSIVGRWLQTPLSDDTCVSVMLENGMVNLKCRLDNYENLQPSVFPALYLNSNVQIVSGDGSQGSPYTLSIIIE